MGISLHRAKLRPREVSEALGLILEEWRFEYKSIDLYAQGLRGPVLDGANPPEFCICHAPPELYA